VEFLFERILYSAARSRSGISLMGILPADCLFPLVLFVTLGIHGTQNLMTHAQGQQDSRREQ